MKKKPVFRIRGSLPWYNFFNSPTTWNLRDYQFFFDQMVKMKNNFVGFHVYNNEPFAAYFDNGIFKMGEPLVTTGEATWGTVPTKTSEFGFGTDSLYDREYFGADAASSGLGRDDKIREQQELLKTALAYAKKRGLKVCVGFEIWGDLTQEQEQKKFRERLVNLLNTYPMLDYVWLWQPECWCGTENQELHYHGLGFPLQPERSSFGTAFRKYADSFSYLSDPRKINEGVRITLYGNFAYDVLKNISPETKLVLSGWGGDKWLQFSDLYEGLNRTLPGDIVFSALDNINPNKEKNISCHYGRVPGRETWPIPWFELDGDQWCPQPFTRQFSYLLKDALEKGCSGILGIHWRTRSVEEVASYTAQFAWNPELDAEEFYKKYAEGLYGKRFSHEMAQIHLKLQDLGYRWVGGIGQDECAPFRWRKTPAVGNVGVLNELGLQVEKLLEQALEQKEWTAYDNLSYLYNNIQWVLGYEKAAETFNDEGVPGEGIKLLLQAEAAVLAGSVEEARELITAAHNAFNKSGLREAMQAFSRTISNRGELGVLAAINSKAYADYKAKAEKLKLLADKIGMDLVDFTEEKGMDSNKALLLVPARNTFSDGSLALDVIIQGGEGACSHGVKVYCHYRKVGAGRFENLEMHKVTPCIFRVVLPVGKDGDLTEYYFEAIEEGYCIGRWPIGAPDKLCGIRNDIDNNGVKAAVKPHCSIELSWNRIDGVPAYNVYRQKKGEDNSLSKVAVSVDNFYEDYYIGENSSYIYQVIPTDAYGIELSTEKWTVEVDTGEFAPPGAPEIKVIAPGRGKAYIYWGGDGLGVKEYRVYRTDSGRFEKQGDLPVQRKVDLCCTVPVLSDGYQAFSWVDTPETERCSYSVTAIGHSGKESEPSQAVEITLNRDPIQPVLSLSMDNSIENPEGYEGKWLTFPLFDKGYTGMAARFLGNNMVYFDHNDKFSPRFELTILCRMKAEKAEGSIVANGITGFRGYALQFKDQKLHFYLSGVGEAEAGLENIEEWQHIAASYDGHHIRLYVNGKLCAEKAAVGRFTDFSGQLRIGLGYTGLMEDLTIWPSGLKESEVLDFMKG